MNAGYIDMNKECLPDTPTIKHSKSTTCYTRTINEPHLPEKGLDIMTGILPHARE